MKNLRKIRYVGNSLKGKRVLKSLSLCIAFIGAGMFFTSCDDWLENDDKYRGWCYGVVSKDEKDVSIRTDKGNVLYPESARYHVGSLKDGERIMAEFFINSVLEKDPYKYEIDLYSVQKILTKDIIPFSEDISDSLGLDPLRIECVWISNGFINFEFVYLGGKPGLKHMVNLALHPKNEDEDFYLLEFRHNAYEDPVMNKQYGLVSFPVSGILPLEMNEDDFKEIPLKIKYKGFYVEEKIIDITWKKPLGDDEERSVSAEALKQQELI